MKRLYLHLHCVAVLVFVAVLVGERVGPREVLIIHVVSHGAHPVSAAPWALAVCAEGRLGLGPNGLVWNASRGVERSKQVRLV